MRHSYCWNLHVLRSLISGQKTQTNLIRDERDKKEPGGVRRLGAVSGQDWMGVVETVLHAASRSGTKKYGLNERVGQSERCSVCVWLHWSGGAIEAVQPLHMLVALVSLIWSAAVRGCHMSYLTTFWHVKAKLRNPSFHRDVNGCRIGTASWEIKPQHTMTILRAPVVRSSEKN
jgi:hypothetical protein